MRSPPFLLIVPFAIAAAAACSSHTTDAAPVAFVPHRDHHRRPSPQRPPLLPTPHRSAGVGGGVVAVARRRTSTTGSIAPPPLRATASSGSNNSPVEISLPTPEVAAAMGIRDWPQQFRTSSWTEEVGEGVIATRYVLDGRGRVTVDYYDDATGESRRIENRRIYPGTLVEVDGEAKLSWDVDDERTGMIVLTPNYEEGGKLLIVGGFLLVFCAGLLLGSGGV